MGLRRPKRKSDADTTKSLALLRVLRGVGSWRRARGGNRLGLKMANARLGGESRHGRESGKTVTRADLSEIVYQKVGLSRTESAELVQSVLDEICDAAARGETVKLSGFGSFVVRSKGERVGRNPKTGVEVPILPRRVMVFKPSNVLKAKINGRDPASEKE
jgi:integration host factor subunit alpha